MIQLIKMAYRDLMRNRRRSFFSALGLGMGLSLLLLMAAVVEGEMKDAIDATIRLQSGHLQVQAGSYDENKTSLAWEDLIENPTALANQIAALAPVEVATPRLLASGIVTTGNKATGVRIVGVDPASEANAPFRDSLVSGSFPAADDRQGMYIGQALADKLGLKAGDSASLLVNTSNGDVDQQAFIVRGVFNTHTPGIDQSTIFLPLAKAQAITGADDRASTIFILLKDSAQSGAVVQALQTGSYRVRTWQDMNEILISTEQYANSYMVVLYLIVLAITATVIVNTLIMSVFERTREIGILAAIGMKRGRIMGMFFAESSLLAIGGILIGLALGALWVLYASKVGFYIGNMGITGMLFADRIYARPSVADAITLTVAAFVVTLLGSLYPAWIAAHMEPVEALHSGQ